MILCRHCGATHDGTTRALDLHPAVPHERPSARLSIRESGLSPVMSSRWFYAVGQYHFGYAYDKECATRAATREVERLGIEVRP